MVQLLVVRPPEALRVADDLGLLPLYELDRYLVELWPAVLQVLDSKGLLPLHVAASAADSTLDLVYHIARQRSALLSLPVERRPNARLFLTEPEAALPAAAGRDGAPSRLERCQIRRSGTLIWC
jgi:hypothetical protein